MSSGSMEVAVARALRRMEQAVSLIAAAQADQWTGKAASAYEQRRFRALARAKAARSNVESALPVARSADAEVEMAYALRGVTG